MADHAAPSVIPDAMERALRTLWQGFIVDGLTVSGTGLLIMLGEGNLDDPLFWSAAGLMVAKSFLVAFASFLSRLKSTPKESSPNA